MNQRHVGTRDEYVSDACFSSEGTYFVGSAYSLHVEGEFVPYVEEWDEQLHVTDPDNHPYSYSPAVRERFVTETCRNALR
jgi:hypothetical protein